MLSSPTCVGLRYGHLKAVYDAFLGNILGATVRSPEGSRYCRGSALADERICLPIQPTHFNVHPSVRGPYAFASRLTL